MGDNDSHAEGVNSNAPGCSRRLHGRSWLQHAQRRAANIVAPFFATSDCAADRILLVATVRAARDARAAYSNSPYTCLAPKIAVPTRTNVAPCAIAIS